MSTKQLIRACFPFLILLIGNGLWALLGIIYKSINAAANGDYVDLIVSYGYAISVFLILYFLYYKRGYGSFDLSTDRHSYLTVIFLSICTFFSISGILGVMSEFEPDFFAQYIYSLNNMTLAYNPFLWIYSVILAPLLEELCFRGLCLTNLSKQYKFATANVITAFLFAIIHASMIQICYAFVLGLVLGRIYKIYGGLKATTVFHAVFNAMNIPLLFLLTNVGTPLQRYMIYMIAGLLPLGIFFLVKLLHSRR